MALALALALAAAAAPPAESAGIEDIVVTARRRVESAQATPVAVTAIGGRQLEQLVAVRLSDAASLSPNLKITTASGSANAPIVFVRGIGTITTAMYAEPAVGLYVDGAYMPRPTGNAFDLPDVERLEALRGPQGTLFGRNTTGGAVLIATTTPTDEASARVSFGFGSEDEVTAGAVIQTGLIGNSGVKAKIAGQYHRRDGWVELPGLSRSDWGGNEEGVNLGLALRGDYGDLTIDNRARYARTDSFSGWEVLGGTPAAIAAYAASAAANPGGPPFVVSGTQPRDISYRDPRSVGNATIEGYSDVLTLEYRLGDARLKSISSYQALDQDLAAFLGGSYVLGRVTSGAVAPVSPHVTLDNPGRLRQFDQELQLSGDRGDLFYLAGLYFHDERVSETIDTILHSVAATTPVPIFVRLDRRIDYSQATRSWAGFGHVAWKPAALDGFELAGGLRYTRDRKREASTTTQTTTAVTSHSARESWDDLGYAASASYKVRPTVMLFGRVASSYRAGGFNTIALAPAPYRPETAVSYELGIKSDLLDRRLRLNASAYRTHYDDLQITQLITTPGQPQTTFISNAARADYKGFEVEATALLGEHLQVDGSLGHVDPRYKRYTFVIAGVPTDVTDEANFAFVPRWTGRLGAEAHTGAARWGALTLRADYALKSSADIAPVGRLAPTTRFVKTGAEKTLSARLIWSEIPLAGSGTFTAQLYGENLTNNRFVTFATDFSSLATATFNRPRSYGLRLTAGF